MAVDINKILQWITAIIGKSIFLNLHNDLLKEYDVESIAYNSNSKLFNL